jgi:hypothetical protein
LYHAVTSGLCDSSGNEEEVQAHVAVREAMEKEVEQTMIPSLDKKYLKFFH